MDLAEAFHLLDLPDTADVGEIDRRYRELAKKHHPDTRGDDASFIQLKTARDLATASAKAGKALVPIVQEIARNAAEEVERRTLLRTASEESSSRVIRRRTSRIKQRQRRELGTALASGGLAAVLALLQQGNTLIHSYAIHRAVSLLIIVFGCLAALVGGISWVTSVRASVLQARLDELNDLLRRLDGFLAVAVEVLAFGVRISDLQVAAEEEVGAQADRVASAAHRFFGESHSIDEIARWCSAWSWDDRPPRRSAVFVLRDLWADDAPDPHDLARRVDAYDLAELLVARGEGHEMITPPLLKVDPKGFRFAASMERAVTEAAVRRLQRAQEAGHEDH
jgi:hypothetical protein